MILRINPLACAARPSDFNTRKSAKINKMMTFEKGSLEMGNLFLSKKTTTMKIATALILRIPGDDTTDNRNEIFNNPKIPTVKRKTKITVSAKLDSLSNGISLKIITQDMIANSSVSEGNQKSRFRMDETG